MRYEGTVYRPPSEAESLLIQATIGCPHNRCTFCSLYKNTSFRIRKVEDIKDDLRVARNYYGDSVQSVFFPDGNTIFMRTSQLIDIFNYTRELFPSMRRITVYGGARFVNLKSEEELRQLHTAGLSRVHMGMESGDDVVLERICKGVTSAEIIEAGKKLKAAGIQTSEYYLVGIGGQDRSREHAINSARVLSAFSPEFIRLRTVVPQPGTSLYQEYLDGAFVLPGPHEALREIRLLIEHLECENSMVLSDHISNYGDVNGMIPEDRRSMIEALDRYLSVDESRYRGPYLEHL